MKLNQISDNAGARKSRVRVGRGIGSGKGKTATRGVKGQKSRSGVAIKDFEGGQTVIHRRLPKRGFNVPFPKVYNQVNVGRIQQAVDAGKLDVGATVDVVALVQAGLITNVRKDGVRLLGAGKISAKVNCEVAGASKGAIAAVEKVGGSVKIMTEPKKDGK